MTINYRFPIEIEELLTNPNSANATSDGTTVTTNLTEEQIKQIKRSWFLGGADFTHPYSIDSSGNRAPISGINMALIAEAAYALDGVDWDEFYQSRIKPKLNRAVDKYISDYLTQNDSREDFIKEALITYFKKGNDGEIAALLKKEFYSPGYRKFSTLTRRIGQSSTNQTNGIAIITVNQGTSFVSTEKAYLDQSWGAGGNGRYDSNAEMVSSVIFHGNDFYDLNGYSRPLEKEDYARTFASLGLNDSLLKMLPENVTALGVAAALGQNQTPLLIRLEDENDISNEVFNKVVSSITGRSAEVTRSVERRLKQCALFLYCLKWKDSWQNKVAKAWGPNPYSGRILPVHPDSIDATEFVNVARCSERTKDDFLLRSKGGAKIYKNLNFKLSWAYSDKQGNTNVIKEVELSYLNTDEIKDSQGLKTKFKSNHDKLFDIERLTDRTSFSDTFEFVEFKLTLEGQTPATARSESKAELVFKLNSMQGLLAPIGIAEIGGDIVQITLRDLITLPTKNENGQAVLGSTTKEYHPDYSRIRIKLYRDSNLDNESDFVLDLGMNSHSISRNSETGEVTLTISYRGYLEQLMNMPMNDALAPIEVLKNRETRRQELQDLANTDTCSSLLLREKMKADQEVSRIESVDSLNKGRFLERIYKSYILRQYHFKRDASNNTINVGDLSVGGTLNPREDYVMLIDETRQAVTFTTNVSNTKKLQDKKEEELEQILEAAFQNNYCFTLGDLMELATDCLYETTATEDADGYYTYVREDTHRNFCKNMNMKFIVSNLKVPNPDFKTGGVITINPVTIPIDLGFFIEWFNEMYTKKGIASINIGAFFRDLLNHLVNQILYDVCYSFLLPDELPPQLIQSYFSDNSTNSMDSTDVRGFFLPKPFEFIVSQNQKEYYYWFDPIDPLANGSKRNMLMRSSALTPVENCKNYCCIFQTSDARFYGSQTKQGNTTLKDSPTCPTLYSGQGFDDFLKDVSFEKTDVPHLRESRIHGTAFGLFSIIANVYNLSFSFKDEMANTFFYPGMIFNFVLTDFAGKTGATFKAGDEVGTESDPHDPSSQAFLLGFGGYYMVTKVQYSRKSDSKEWQITINSKFCNSDGVSDPVMKSEYELLMEQSQDCKEGYNISATRVLEASITTDIAAPRFNLLSPSQ